MHVWVKAKSGALPLGAIFGGIGTAAVLGVGLLHLDRLPLTLCVFKVVTGWPCLTCGSTRVLGRLFALDLAGAIAVNPLAALGALALVPWAAADMALMVWGRALTLDLSARALRVLQVLAVVLIVLNWSYLLATGR